MTGENARDRMLKMIRASECTLLSIESCSKNCIDVIVELANVWSLPVMLAADREEVEYVRAKDTKSNIVLCGGHDADVQAGYGLIRIDATIENTFEEKMGVLLEQYSRAGTEVLFEACIDAPIEGFQDVPRFHEMLDRLVTFCKKNRLRLPTFVTAQTGTKVTDMRNTGMLSRLLENSRRPVPPPALTEILKICDKYGVALKAQSVDFLSNEVLEWFPRLGIHAAHIGVELAVIEKRAIERVGRNDEVLKADLRRNLLRYLYSFNLVADRRKRAA